MSGHVDNYWSELSLKNQLVIDALLQVGSQTYTYIVKCIIDVHMTIFNGCLQSLASGQMVAVDAAALRIQ